MGLTVEPWWALFAGCLLMMMVYHLMLFASIRIRNDLLFAVLILVVLLFELTDSGFAYAWLWPNGPAWAGKAPNMLAAAGLLLLSLLGRNLLVKDGASASFYDRAHRAYAGISAICLVVCALVGEAAGLRILKLLFFLFLLLALLAAASALRGKLQAARYYAIGLFLWFLGLLVGFFKGSWLPVHWLTENAVKIGAFLFLMSLSFSSGANWQRMLRETGRERKKRQQLELLYDYSHKMLTTLDPGMLGDIALTGLKEMLGASKGWLWSAAGQAADPFSDAVREIINRLGPEKKSLWLRDTDRISLGLPQERGRCLAVPLVNHGQVLALAILLLEHHFQSSEDIPEEVAMLAAQAGRALANAQRFKEKDQLATVDELTGLLNRRGFFERAREEWRKCAASGRPLAVAMIDADDFKLINDTYGHAAGDRLLRKLAVILRDNFKGKDVIGRYGGEEFSVVMPNTELHEAVAQAERLCREIELEGKNDGIPRFTVSIGVSAADLETTAEDSLSEVLLRADQALYAAKRQGRNRVVLKAEDARHFKEETVNGDPA